MIVYRICRAYPPNHDPIDGKGAFLRGGRWNPKGVYAVYTASSLALARAELARHINLDNLPIGFSVYEIEIPEKYVAEIEPLPEKWNDEGDWQETQNKGKAILSNPDVLAIKVPSVCDANSFNYILNPQSSYFNKVKVFKQYEFVT